MKLLVVCSLACLLIFPVFGQEYLKDVPRGHWAYGPVYELIRLGVTNGYPDGTFQGKKDMSRFEMAAFLSKFANAVYKTRNSNEKLVHELASELTLLKHEQEKENRETKITGKFSADFFAALQPVSGGKFSYRLQTRLTKQLVAEGKLLLNLDTMDAGYNNSAGRIFAVELFDAAAVFPNLRLALGPGNIVHHDNSGLAPIEEGIIFERPYPAVEIYRNDGWLKLSAAYRSRQTAVSGRIGLQEISLSGQLGPLTIAPGYFFDQSGSSDALAEITLRPNDWQQLTMGIGGNRLSGLYIKVRQAWQEILGVEGYFQLERLGGQYRTDLIRDNFIVLDNFNRPIADNRINVSWGLQRRLGPSLFLEKKGNYLTGLDGAGNRYTEEWLLSILPAKKIKPALFFRYDRADNQNLLIGLSVTSEI